MKNFFNCVVILSLSLLVGCSWLKAKPKAVESARPQYIESAKIVNKEKLVHGVRVGFMGFKAGADVEANEELDRVSLMIVKGAVDAIEQNSSHYKVVTGDEAEQADLLVEGHIISRIEPTRIKRMVLRKKNKQLSVKGKVIDRKSGETVAVFTHKKNSKSRKVQLPDLGYNLGTDLGNYLCSQVPP